MERIDEDFLNDVMEKSAFVREALSGAEGVVSVSGMGLMVGIETERPAADVVRECIAEGVLCLTAKTKVRLLPALNISREVLSEAVEIIKRVCAKKEQQI